MRLLWGSRRQALGEHPAWEQAGPRFHREATAGQAALTVPHRPRRAPLLVARPQVVHEAAAGGIGQQLTGLHEHWQRLRALTARPPRASSMQRRMPARTGSLCSSGGGDSDGRMCGGSPLRDIPVPGPAPALAHVWPSARRISRSASKSCISSSNCCCSHRVDGRRRKLRRGQSREGAAARVGGGPGHIRAAAPRQERGDGRARVRRRRAGRQRWLRAGAGGQRAAAGAHRYGTPRSWREGAASMPLVRLM